MELDHIAYIDIRISIRIFICAVILAPNKLLTRSSLHCTAPRAPAPPLSPTEGEGLEHTLRHFSTNLEEATTSVERTKDELVGKRKSSGSVIWRWFRFKVLDEQQIFFTT